MKSIAGLSALALALAFNFPVQAQTYETNNVTVQTFVGSGFYGYVDGQGLLTMFYDPSSIVADASGTFFVLDDFNYRIRKITPGGGVTTFAGGGALSPPGYGTNVSLANYSFSAMAIDHSNNLWVASSYSGSGLLRIAPDGLVLPIIVSGMSQARSICVDSKNNVYVADASNKIYRYSAGGDSEVFAGSGNAGSVDGNGIFTSFDQPGALAVDSADNIYVWDVNNRLIRRITAGRDVTTIAGNKTNNLNADGVGFNASFVSVSGMCADRFGNLFLTCGSDNYGGSGTCIRKISASTNVTTLAGSFTQSDYANGAGAQALFSGASGLCISQGVIFVADSNNQRIRSIAFDQSPEPVSPADLQLSTYPGLRINGVVGRTYRIESSTDGIAWGPETTLLLTSTPYLWVDQNPVSGNKFYRALLLP